MNTMKIRIDTPARGELRCDGEVVVYDLEPGEHDVADIPAKALEHLLARGIAHRAPKKGAR